MRISFEVFPLYLHFHYLDLGDTQARSRDHTHAGTVHLGHTVRLKLTAREREIRKFFSLIEARFIPLKLQGAGLPYISTRFIFKAA